MLNKLNYILSFLLFCFVSCTPDSLTEKKLYAFIKDTDNGLFQEIKEDPFTVSLMYKPSALVAKQEIEVDMTPKEKEDVYKRYEKYMYFVLNYSYKGQELLNAFGGNRPKFAELVQTLSFGMKEKINVITDQKKKVPLMDFIHSRHYGMGSGSMVLLVFKKNEILSQTNKDFIIKLKDIGVGLGNQSFKYDKNEIIQCPTIKE
ncbi:MAG: hypothetical protein ACPGSD_15135 [Flavobacteriales bacterium]